MAGPREQVLVSRGDVEYFVHDVAQEDGNLRGRDEVAFAGVGVAVHRGGAVAGRTKVP